MLIFWSVQKNITFVEDYPVNMHTKFQELKCKSLDNGC